MREQKTEVELAKRVPLSPYQVHQRQQILKMCESLSVRTQEAASTSGADPGGLHTLSELPLFQEKITSILQDSSP